MVESRCGLCCSKFNCKEDYGFDCDGCVNIKSAPWGECGVKVCCENRKHDHCGECADFPCDILKKFSYDETHGDDGKRIEQCRKWLKK